MILIIVGTRSIEQPLSKEIGIG